MPYALHETLETHELAAFKALCLTMSKTMQALVSDPDLKQIMQLDVEISTKQLEQLNGLLRKAAGVEVES